jgi:hypothetical protein
VANLVSFNIGVELGQFLALALILMLMTLWRQTPSFRRGVVVTNALLMCAGLVLTGYQITGFLTETSV